MCETNNLILQPRLAAILMTYQCTAKCDECCFSCSPSLKNTALSYEKIKSFLDQISEIPSIKIVVFTGGECFINFHLLKKCIRYAHDIGLMTRCVTNGFWANSIENARRKIKELKAEGLSELNFSTGDSHQEFIPIEKVLNGVIACAEEKLEVCVSVETNDSKNFKVEDFINHPLFLENIKSSTLEEFVDIIPATWVSFHSDNTYIFDSNLSYEDTGCNGMFDTIALEGRGDIMGCCGLTSNDIKELHLGKLTDNNLSEMLFEHQSDFIKIWIFVEGAKKVFEQASAWAGEIPEVYAHKCLYCAYLYNNPKLLKAIQENYQEVQEDILSRYLQKSVQFNLLTT